MSDKIISDYRSEALQGRIKLVDSKGNEKICVGTKPIILSNQWKPVRKGDIITIAGKDYRVLKVNKNIAEVMCMYDGTSEIKFDSTSSGYNNIYAEKNIDVYCNSTFYNALSAQIKAAIVDKTFTQDSWTYSSSIPTESHYTGKYGSSTYYLTLENAAFAASITRHCYCLSIQDVLDYLGCTVSMGSNDTTLTRTNLRQMFWNATALQSGIYIWLQSGGSERSTYAFIVDGSGGYLDYDSVNRARIARPAFQIDLSKVDYTIL